jgi:hypothetical protein
VAASACQEKLATPTDCPALCPGNSLTIRDTILTARLGLDSTFTGYLNANLVGALLVSNGISGGEARTFAQFPARADSIFVLGAKVTYTVDSVGFLFTLIARDTAVRSLRLLAYRIPVSVDTSTSFEDVDAALTPENLIDSVLVSDTLKNGTIALIVKGDALQRIAPSEADSGKLGIALRVNGLAPTGIRLGSEVSGATPPLFTSYVHANVTDTSLQRQSYNLDALASNYVIQTPPVDPTELFLGGKSGSRMVLRFSLPREIKDSGAVVRATLELTPVGPLKGLSNDPGELQVRAVLVDLGAKSPVLATLAATAPLAAGSSGVQSIDLRSLVETWIGANGLPPTMLLGLAPEGGTFLRPEFFSSLTPNAPRLRITYAVSSHPGHP